MPERHWGTLQWGPWAPWAPDSSTSTSGTSPNAPVGSLTSQAPQWKSPRGCRLAVSTSHDCSTAREVMRQVSHVDGEDGVVAKRGNSPKFLTHGKRVRMCRAAETTPSVSYKQERLYPSLPQCPNLNFVSYSSKDGLIRENSL